jgi:GTPase SAR1 family protein
MIIEMFGPPGAGKTTLSRALIARLRERGYPAELRLSYRPSERSLVLDARRPIAKRYHNAVVDRLRRPFLEMLAIACHPLANSRDMMTAVHLVRLLPPTNILASIKEGQYLLRLSHSWHDECRLARVVLFDQGFVQAVCSLALLAGAADDALIANALEYAPKSDLLIRMVAPLELLRARLHDRRSRQSTIEQLFESDLKTSLASTSMIDRLHELLLLKGRSVLSVSSIDQRSLDESVNLIEREISRKFQSRAQRSSAITPARAAAAHRGRDRHA